MDPRRKIFRITATKVWDDTIQSSGLRHNSAHMKEIVKEMIANWDLHYLDILLDLPGSALEARTCANELFLTSQVLFTGLLMC